MVLSLAGLGVFVVVCSAIFNLLKYKQINNEKARSRRGILLFRVLTPLIVFVSFKQSDSDI